jgi:hypothetical protein
MEPFVLEYRSVLHQIHDLLSLSHQAGRTLVMGACIDRTVIVPDAASGNSSVFIS